MRRFLILTAFFVGATWIAPVAMTADDHHDNRDRRYYDRDARDYHSWDNQEDRAYRVYLEEQHRDYRDFNRVKRPTTGVLQVASRSPGSRAVQN